MKNQTENLSLDLIDKNQLGKEMLINEALIAIDNLIHHRLVDVDVNLQPKRPKRGDVYATGENPSGDWAYYKKCLAIYDNGWRFFKLQHGYFAWVEKKDSLMLLYKGDWKELETITQSKV